MSLQGTSSSYRCSGKCPRGYYGQGIKIVIVNNMLKIKFMTMFNTLLMTALIFCKSPLQHYAYSLLNLLCIVTVS